MMSTLTTRTLSMRRATASATGRLLPLWWYLTGVVGWVGGLTLKTVIEVAADIGGFTAALEAIPGAVFGALFGAMLGIGTAATQWLVLRRRLAGVRGPAFIAATLAAWVLFWTMHNGGILPFAHSPWGLVLQGFGHGALVGVMIGAAQWLALREHLPNAGRWVLTCTVSWSVAGAIMHFVLDVAFASANIHGPFDILMTSALAALFSGVALQRLIGAQHTQTK